MSAPTTDTRVTVYSKAGCNPCKGTIKALEKRGIPHEVRKVDEDPTAHDALLAEGFAATPVVVVEHPDSPREVWSGHYITKIEALERRLAAQITA